jgi:hemerythrin-like domain-containing protein
LFPKFEQATGSAMGPTQVMKAEHAQMRQLFKDMQSAVDDQDKDRYLGLSETLMIVMQQHNMKEEQILYRMADQAFGDIADEILHSMDGIN